MPIRVLTLLYLHPLSMFFLYFLRKLIAVYTCMIRQKSKQSKAVGLKKIRILLIVKNRYIDASSF